MEGGMDSVDRRDAVRVATRSGLTSPCGPIESAATIARSEFSGLAEQSEGDHRTAVVLGKDAAVSDFRQ